MYSVVEGMEKKFRQEWMLNNLRYYLFSSSKIENEIYWLEQWEVMMKRMGSEMEFGNWDCKGILSEA
jgi:hypothetical protein